MNLCRSKDVVLVCRFMKYVDDTCVISVRNMIIKCIVHAFELLSGKISEETMIAVVVIFGIK